MREYIATPLGTQSFKFHTETIIETHSNWCSAGFLPTKRSTIYVDIETAFLRSPTTDRLIVTSRIYATISSAIYRYIPQVDVNTCDFWTLDASLCATAHSSFDVTQMTGYNSVSFTTVYWVKRTAQRRGGRVVECTRLEIWRTVLPYREFESHPLRQVTSKYAPHGAFCFFYPS